MDEPEILERKFYKQSEAKAQLFELCRRAIRSGERIYVKDKGGYSYLTLSAKKPKNTLPSVEVSAQRFKDNFSRFSYLIKDGFTFKLRLKGETDLVFARAHSKYRDPLKDVIDDCFAQLRGDTAGNDEDEDDSA